MQCAIGLEELLLAELEAQGVVGRPASGGVECRGNAETLSTICLTSRVAESVRVRLKEFDAKEFGKLEQSLRALPFRAFLPAGTKVKVRVVCHHSRLWHSGAVRERVETVLKAHVGWEPTSDSDVIQVVHVRLDEDRVQVSLDATGERLSRRGYRRHVEKASVRETLAAALVRVVPSEAKVDPSEVPAERPPIIWDPFCGAGTILLEALEVAHGRVAGSARQFAFERWRGHSQQELVELRSLLTERLLASAPAPALVAIGSDRDGKAISAATENAKAAGLESFCTFLQGDIDSVVDKIPRGARIATNPPYGKRIQEAGAMKKLLGVLSRRPDLAPVVVLVGGAARELVPKECPALFRTKNGGIPVSARLVRA